MKIKPDDICIPPQNPFEHDLLERSQSAHILTNLLHNLNPPYTMSIDASWGNGKTTFLNMWRQHLKNKEFAVVGFNAWETDFAEFPLIALTSELLHTLKSLDHKGDLGLDAIATTLPRFLAVALTKAVPWTISAAGVIAAAYTNEPIAALAGQTIATGVSGIMEEVVETEPSDNQPEPLTYIEAKEAINSFRNALANTAEKLSEKHHGKPLIITIDELDRCRPSYAVELLEIVKHFFTVDNIVFILAIDKTQLSHAIKAIYGNDFDATDYLRRFIDLDFRLPDPDRKDLIDRLLNNVAITSFLNNHQPESWGNSEHVSELLTEFLRQPTLSIRQIQQILHHLGLVMNSVSSTDNLGYGAVAVLTILKTIDAEIYRQFVQANITDQEVSDKLFSIPGLQKLRFVQTHALFESYLIMGFCEFVNSNNTHPDQESTLLAFYSHIIENTHSFLYENPHTNNELINLSNHQKNVLTHLRNHYSMLQTVQRGKPVGFNLTSQRLELFSNDLIS